MKIFRMVFYEGEGENDREDKIQVFISCSIFFRGACLSSSDLVSVSVCLIVCLSPSQLNVISGPPKSFQVN